MAGGKEVYRDHEIVWDVNLSADSGLWKPTGEIFFPHNASLPTIGVPIIESDRFATEEEARQFILSKAKTWIEHRVG
jgi:hypothetical protein